MKLLKETIMNKKIKTLDLFKIIKDAEPWKKWTSLFLAFVYGLAVPFGTIALKDRAVSQQDFLFIQSDFLFLDLFLLAPIFYWLCCIFCAAVSLHKVYEFLVAAFRNKIVAFLSCIGFEVAFITSTEWFGWLGFFFLVIAVANVIQACAGFIEEDTELNKESLKTESLKEHENTYQEIIEDVDIKKKLIQ